MELIRVKTYGEMSKKAADLLAEQVRNIPECTLGLATGSTPIGMYEELAKLYAAGDVSFSQVTTVNLDEYRGLQKDNVQSYCYFMFHHFFGKVDVDLSKTNIPDGMAADPEAECRRYDALIKRLGGVDIQVLGIGRNGHIGFNEPADSYAKGTHVVDLEASTIEANKRFFRDGESVPEQAYSMGIGTILSARRILLLASGEDKAWAVKQLVDGAVTPRVPCAILQFHGDVTVIADDEACGLL